MGNHEQDRTVQICLTAVFGLGIISVFIYILFGSIYAVYSSLGIYAFAFSILSLFSIRKLFVIASYKERLNMFENGAQMSESEKDVYNQKKSEALKVVNKTKRIEILKAIISGAVAIFAVVVLVLF